MIAHDLRNPFAQFINILELVEKEAATADEMVVLLPSVNRSAQHTMEIMDNLLIWSKSQLNGFKVNHGLVSIHSLSQGTLDYLQNQVTEKKLEIQTTKLENYIAWADHDMRLIVVRNLLSNAIKIHSRI